MNLCDDCTISDDQVKYSSPTYKISSTFGGSSSLKKVKDQAFSVYSL